MDSNKEIINELKELTEKHLKISEYDGYISIINEGIEKLNNMQPSQPVEPKLHKSFVDENRLERIVENKIKLTSEYKELFESHNTTANSTSKLTSHQKKSLEIIDATLIMFTVVSISVIIAVRVNERYPGPTPIVFGVLAAITGFVAILITLILVSDNKISEHSNSYYHKMDEANILKSDEYNDLFKKVYYLEYERETQRLEEKDKELYEEKVEQYKKLMEKYNFLMNSLKEKEADFTNELNIYKDHKNNATAELENTILKCKYIPPTYASNSIATMTLLSYFENKRADSLKEAINLYEMEKHLGKISESLETTNSILNEGFQATYFGISLMTESISKSLDDYKNYISSETTKAFSSTNNLISSMHSSLNEKIENSHNEIEGKIDVIDYKVSDK